MPKRPPKPAAKTTAKPTAKVHAKPALSIAASAPNDTLERIAAALERLAPAGPATPGFAAADAFSWHPDGRALVPVPRVNRVEMSLLKGIDRMRDVLVENTERFAKGLPANNALLWGARGMAKAAATANKATGCSSWSRSTARTSRACPT
jgi:uncharacterized protein